MDALSAEGAIGIAKIVVKLRGDLGMETAVGDCDGIVALLFSADANAAVTRDTLFVVAKDEGVFVFEV